MKHFRLYIREQIRWLAVIVFLAIVMAATMLLNNIPLREILYGMILCFFIFAVAVLTGYSRHYDSFRWLEQMQNNTAEMIHDMKPPEYMYENQYQACLRSIACEKNEFQNRTAKRQQDMSEYYSMWVHQIKTPIAALKLLIDENIRTYADADNNNEETSYLLHERQKQQELFRIEQYVDMALQYTRLGSETNDFVIQKVLLDEVIKPSIHKYARQFIHKKLRLSYVPHDIMAITDKKWLGFVIDQLLSNAVKYTKQGGVTISVVTTPPYDDEHKKDDENMSWYDRTDRTPDAFVSIIIEDTGIGISAQDLPRICEKGYTGYNGHADRYSTGIGLYLCREILDKLGHRLVITSEPGCGTTATIILRSVHSSCQFVK